MKRNQKRRNRVKANRKKQPKRFWWLISQIQLHNYKIGAEVGCMEGATSSKLLKFCPKLKLICVDLWESDYDVLSDYCKETYKAWDFDEIKRRFDYVVSPYRHRVTELQGLSWEMADRVEDGSLDFVFIDADHSYESVKKDIIAWVPKLKPGGLLSGHDIHLEGVLKAVKELTVNWTDTEVNHVWCCKKENYVY